ncbi:MAG: hypothetical protein K2H35_04940 [Muribaculaceae bacterium]|nr:hypothetical protein [Muribaculaceae bacterium]
MVYRFKLVSDELSNFAREIEIDSENTFLQLRNVILDSVGYSKDEIDSFFLCDEDWSRHEEITLEDMGSNSDEDVWLMEDTPISELVEEEGQRLAFVFDYDADRSFFMELKDIIPGRSLVEPICIMQKGKAPAQWTELAEPEVKIDTATPVAVSDVKADMDLDFYDEDSFDDEDLANFNDDISLS